MIDHYTKVAEVAPLYSKDMCTVRGIIEHRIIKKYGVPRIILTDNGKEFKNHEMAQLAKEHGFIWRHGSPYNPTTTGLVERFNKTFVSKLRKITEFGKYDWGKCINKTLLAYMHSYNRALDCAPIELLEGQSVSSMDKSFGFKSKKGKGVYEKRVEAHKRNYESTIRNNLSFKGESKTLKVGDRILYKVRIGLSEKLSPVWECAGTVKETMFNSYKILLDDGRTVVASRNHVKSFKEGKSVGV